MVIRLNDQYLEKNISFLKEFFLEGERRTYQIGIIMIKKDTKDGVIVCEGEFGKYADQPFEQVDNWHCYITDKDGNAKDLDPSEVITF